MQTELLRLCEKPSLCLALSKYFTQLLIEKFSIFELDLRFAEVERFCEYFIGGLMESAHIMFAKNVKKK